MHTQREKLWNVKILFTLILAFALSAPALAAATYDLLTGDNSHFTTGVGDWQNMGSTGSYSAAAHETVDGNTAPGALQGITHEFGFPPIFSDIRGQSRSGCLAIDYTNWPGATKSVTFSGYVKNVSTTGITPYIWYIDENTCLGAFVETFGSQITASGWTFFSVTADMVDGNTGWDPDSIRVGFRATGSAENQTFLADDLQVFSSTPTAISLQSFGAHTVGSLGYLAVILLAVGAAALVLVRRKRAIQ